MGRTLAGRGTVDVAAPPDRVWSALLDPDTLLRLIPGADRVERPDPYRYCAVLSFGVGRVRGRYDARLLLSDVVAPHRLDLAGQAQGWLGGGRAVARVVLTERGPSGTTIAWRYDGVITGPVALVGTALLQATSSLFVQRFFAALARHVATVPAIATAPVAS